MHHCMLPNCLPHATADVVIHFIANGAGVWMTPRCYSRFLTMPGNINALPPGMNSMAIISPSLQTLMIGHTFLILLIPLLAALFYYSTPYGRRQPIFILNLLALSLAFTAAVITDVMNVSAAFWTHSYTVIDQ